MDDSERFRALFEATFRTVRQYAHNRGLSYGRADDLVAETYLVAWRRRDVVPVDDPLPWLLAVARNLRLNELRSDRRRAAFLRRLPVPEPVPPPDEPAEPAESGRVREALAALAEADRELLMLVAWDDLTPTRAAQVLGYTPGAVRTRLHRARRRFAEELARRAGPNGQDTGDSQRTEEARP